MKNTILHANGAINDMVTFFKELQMFGGISETFKRANAGENLLSTIKSAHTVKDASGNVDKFKTGARILGSYMSLSAAGRIATGGGLYKDSKGNTDIIGIPFI